MQKKQNKKTFLQISYLEQVQRDEHAPPQQVQEGEAQAEDAGTSSTSVEPQEKNEQLSAAFEQPSAAAE